MRLILQGWGRTVADIEVLLWCPRPTDDSDAPTLEAAGHLAASELADTVEPDTTTFGFSPTRSLT